MNSIENKIADITLNRAVLISGLGLLAMTIFAIFAEFFVFQNLVVKSDAAATVQNITANEMQFRAGIISFLIVIICDVIVAWSLYLFLKPVNKNLSLLAGWFRLVYAVIFAISLFNLVAVPGLLTSTDYLKAFGTEQLNAQVMFSLTAFSDGWSVGFIFFGIHLILLGYLIFKSGYVPSLFGILLMIAGIGYLADSIGKLLVHNFDMSLSIFTAWGELLFMFWLLIKGAKLQHEETV